MAVLGLKGRKVAVVGAGPSAIALVRFLVRRGAVTKLVDARPTKVLEEGLSEQLDLSKFTLEGGEASGPQAGQLPAKAFEDVQQIVVTPGLPLDSKALEAARTAGVQVVSELEFVAEYIEEPIIAIAGTNGKSTTAALLARILEEGGKNVFSNALQPLANYLNLAKPADYVVAVATSFQLEGTTNFKPRAILFLNLSEDHMNRYPNFETYLAANREVLKNADAETLVVVNAQDPQVMAFTSSLTGRTLYFTSEDLPAGLEGAQASRAQMSIRLNNGQHQFALNNFRLRGAHNRENLMAASLAALALGIKPEAIKGAIEHFSALPHRIEFLRRINSVAFYDDACSGNVMGVLRTLQAFSEPVILISGGRDKNADYSPLIPHIRQRVKNLILVGEAKEKINRAIGDFTETFLVGTLEEALILAYQKSRSGDVVLFSPGCDPTDMFGSHEDKGDYFKKLVSQIAQPRRPNVI